MSSQGSVAPSPPCAGSLRAVGLAFALLVLAGCGGEERSATPPPLPSALAERLAMRSEEVADRLDGGDACAARAEARALQAETIAAVNDRRIPPRYQEALLASVTALVESIACEPAPPPADGDQGESEGEEENDEGNGKGKKKGKKKGKGKG